MILVVPMLTILLVFFQSKNIVREMILSSSRNTLNQFFKRVDAVLKDAEEICLSVGNRQECRLYASYAITQPEKTAYKAWAIKNLIEGYKGEAYYDIFAYYPGNDKIVSGMNASLSADDYCEIFYGKAVGRSSERYSNRHRPKRRKQSDRQKRGDIYIYGVDHWNSWFHASIYLRENELLPLQNILRHVLTAGKSVLGVGSADAEEFEESIKYAAIVVSTVPILCVYPFLQKYFAKEALVGAVKG